MTAAAILEPVETTETAEEAPAQKKAVRFAARSFLAFALTPEAPLADWLTGIDTWTENSPGFFAGRPVVLDLTVLKPEADAIGGIVSELAARGIRVYAIEATGIETLGPHLPPLLKNAKATTVEGPKEEDETSAAEIEAAAEDEADEPASTTLIIDTPVRSGQSIYHPEGDVIVMGSVASGSEILAGGSIHVYGTLRGRAFAGATGNDKARIFCRKNHAELLAVDGWYRTAEDIEPSTFGRPIQAYFDDGVVFVAALS